MIKNKKTNMRSIKTLCMMALAMVFLLLGGITIMPVTAYADELVGTVVKIGDTIDFGGSYVLCDDSDNTIGILTTFTLAEISDHYIEAFGQWDFLTSDVSSISISGTYKPTPIGFKVSGGTGTQNDPYTFALVFEETVSINLVGTVVKQGDSINFDNAYVKFNDNESNPYINTYANYLLDEGINSDTTVFKLDGIEFDNYGQWKFLNSETGMSIYITGYKTVIPVGFKVVDGRGTQKDPFILNLVFEGALTGSSVKQGGTIDFEDSYVLIDDTDKSEVYNASSFRIKSITWNENYYIWEFENDNKYHDYFYFSGFADVKPVGFFISGGTGTENDPYTLALLYEDDIITLINFLPGDGSGTMPVAAWVLGRKYTLPKCTFSGPNDDQEFAGWKLEESEELLQAGNKIKVPLYCTFIATWKDKTTIPTTYTVTFVGNGGKWPDDEDQKEVTVDSGSDVTVPSGLKYEGYTFDGWNTKQDGTGETAVLTNITSNNTFYAKWKKVEEKPISSDDDTISGSDVNPNISDDVDTNIAIQDPTLFLVAKVKESAKKKTATITLKWNKVSGATGYEVYGTSCEDGSELAKISTLDSKKKSYKISSVEWNKCYKYVVKAIGSNGKVLKESLGAHVVVGSETKTNVKKITAKKLKLTVGKESKIVATATPCNKTKKAIWEGHIKNEFRYYSSDTNVATVTEDGKITTVAEGKVTIYVIASNGVKKAVKVIVK